MFNFNELVIFYAIVFITSSVYGSGNLAVCYRMAIGTQLLRVLACGCAIINMCTARLRIL